MSYELQCVKRSIHGDLHNLPDDQAFVVSYRCHNVEQFFNEYWTEPAPCFFVWAPNEMLFDVPGTVLYETQDYALVKTNVTTFNRLELHDMRTFIDGESGFMVTHTP